MEQHWEGTRAACGAGLDPADVCIIGAGHTGLWTAYYLKKAAPQLLLLIVESISFVLVNKNVDTSGPVLID